MSGAEAATRSTSQVTQVDVDAWYRRYGESVYRRSLRLCRRPAQALDLTQEVFLRAHRYRDSYRGAVSPLAWLLTIAQRCFYDSLGRPEPVDAGEIDALVRDEDEGAETVFARQEVVAKLLGRMPDDVRRIVVHRYFDELEHEEIAARLGINEKTVRRKLEGFLARAKKLART